MGVVDLKRKKGRKVASLSVLSLVKLGLVENHGTKF